MGLSSGRGSTRPTLPGSREARGLRGTTFGPVPSRRFGRSLGINNIPRRVCTYSCVYCQVGRAMQVYCDRRVFFGAGPITTAVLRRIEDAGRACEPIDCLTFIPDGEPTLDVGLGRAIHVLRALGIPIAVVTNGSLLSRADVRAALAEADRVSVKVDAVHEESWRTIDRPHRRMALGPIMNGMRTFASTFEGTLLTETMLVEGVNDSDAETRATAAFVRELDPETAYLTVPTRPPAEPWALPPDERVLARAHEVFCAHHPRVELLIGHEGEAIASTGNPAEDLLALTGVHPVREGALSRLLARAGASWQTVEKLLESGRLVEVRYGAHRYYMHARPGRLRGAGPEPREADRGLHPPR